MGAGCKWCDRCDRNIEGGELHYIAERRGYELCNLCIEELGETPWNTAETVGKSLDKLRSSLTANPSGSAPIATTERPEMREYHPSVVQILRYFAYEHLPPHLQEVSKPFHDLAYAMANNLEGPELTVGLRKLLEAKDCMVRAAVDQVRTKESGV